ncbi:MAG: T9SS type A sorting domain-containing protein [Flavobacteriales bacterium]
MARSLPKLALALLCGWSAHLLPAQTTVFFQGFETGTVCNAWDYVFSGADGTNTELVRTGSRSARVGRLGGSALLTFSSKDISGLSGVTLELYHAVRGGSGPGMDWSSTGGYEGAVVEVQLNGGAWTAIGRVNGGSDATWSYSQTGGNASAGCKYTMPNPLTYAVPAGTDRIALRVYSTNANACPSSTPATYDRNDEGFFIDDVRLTTTTSPVPAVWMGSTNTDWHTCTNWLYGSVPTTTLPAIIDQRAVSDCVISTGAATCKSLAVSSNTATSRNLTIQSSRKLTVVNDVTVMRTAAGPEVGITLLSSGQLECAALTLTGSSAGARNAFLRDESALNTVLVKADLTLNAGALLDLEGTAAGGTLQLQGNYTNNDQESAFDEGFSTVQFQGSSAQTISTPGFEERFHSIRLSKSANDLTLSRAVRMGGILSWTTNGLLITNATDLLTMEATATVTTAANGRFVHGPVRKLGNADFTFPIGKGTAYRAAQISGGTDVNSDITAEYFPASAQLTFGTSRDLSLHHVSDCEYWSITRASGTGTPYIWLSWASPNSCGVTALPELRVAHWNGGVWTDRGSGGTTGNTTAGTIRTEDYQSAFGYFTLASTTAGNPLPIELLRFEAVPGGKVVRCTWTTAVEADNDRFLVERGADAVAFDPVGIVPGAGNSQHLIDYAFDDPAPLEGLSYYRLRQIDRDGTSTVSPVVPVLFQSDPGLVITEDGQVYHHMAAGSLCTVFDAGGRSLWDGRADAPTFRLPVERFNQGVYILRISDGAIVRTQRFIR